MRQGCDDEYGQTVETPENENCDGSARDEVEPTRWRPTPAPNTGAEHRRRAHRVALAEQPLRWGTILVLARALVCIRRVLELREAKQVVCFVPQRSLRGRRD